MTERTSAPLVSILSPVFNESAHLEEMIESVLAQSHTALELILVDDGSTDDTVAKAQAASARDPRVRVIDEGKHGKVGAFNRAFAASRGEVILLLGGDDVLPVDSVATRAAAVIAARTAQAPRVAGFARLVTFSEDPKFDGQIIPRNPERGARSGGTIAMSRELAEVAFPIPTTLVAEDLWVGGIADAVADAHRDISDIVLHYRIHGGNSNPRGQSFPRMTESMHARMNAYRLLSETQQAELSDADRQRFATLADVEDKRYAGSLLGVLTHRGASWGTRLRAASMTSPWLFAVRTRLFKLFSGW
ncbi:glycosyltransferase family 2 protein [Microbacterium sp. EST19A]|uniref:glycosyltransferase family 2 protein n=1 Tax=Microbacterium sp. EST19A TaxID=2862681 RepID=UPI001CBEAE6F|nr:glycosyltransferase family 2 protein [Microbacterium sp. EST19A]